MLWHVVLLALAEFMAVLVELVAFTRREAPMTMVPDWGNAST